MDFYSVASSRPFTHGQISWETIRDYIVFTQTQLNVAEYTGVLISYWISFSVFIFAFQRSLSYNKFVRSIYSFDI